MQSEEYQADGMGMVYAVETGANPLAIVELREKIAEEEAPQVDWHQPFRFGRDRPLTASRVSRASAKAEELADRKDFPKMRPEWKSLANMLRSLPPPSEYPLNKIRSDIAANEDATAGYELLGQYLGTPSYGERPSADNWQGDYFLFSHKDRLRAPIWLSEKGAKTWEEVKWDFDHRMVNLSPSLFVEFLARELELLRSRIAKKNLS